MPKRCLPRWFACCSSLRLASCGSAFRRVEGGSYPTPPATHAHPTVTPATLLMLPMLRTASRAQALHRLLTNTCCEGRQTFGQSRGLAVFSNPSSLSHTPLTSTATPTPPCPPITQPRFMPQPLHPRTPLLGVVTLQLTLTSITSITATTPSSEAFWGALPVSSAVRV